MEKLLFGMILKEIERTGSQRKNQDYADNSNVKIT